MACAFNISELEILLLFKKYSYRHLSLVAINHLFKRKFSSIISRTEYRAVKYKKGIEKQTRMEIF